MAEAVNVPVPGQFIVPIWRLTDHHLDRQSEAADLFSVSAIMTEDRADSETRRTHKHKHTHARTHAQAHMRTHTHTHTGPTGRILIQY